MKKFSPSLCLRVGFPTLALCAAIFWLPGCSSDSFSEATTDGNRQINLSATLTTADGDKVTLAELDGKVFFINFWATWCAPCRLEMPSMAALYEQLREEGLVMVAITDEDPMTIRTFLDTNPFPFLVLLDRDGGDSFTGRHGVRVLPTTLVTDAAGQLIFQHMGARNWDSPQIVEKFRQLLAQ